MSRRLLLLFGTLWLGTLLGCAQSQKGSCIFDADCDNEGVFGVCVSTFCAYPNGQCASGYSFAEGPDASQCVPEDDLPADTGGESESMGEDGGGGNDEGAQPDMGAGPTVQVSIRAGGNRTEEGSIGVGCQTTSGACQLSGDWDAMTVGCSIDCTVQTSVSIACTTNGVASRSLEGIEVDGVEVCVGPVQCEIEVPLGESDVDVRCNFTDD